MTNPSPSLVQVTISYVTVLFTISKSFTRKDGTWYIDWFLSSNCKFAAFEDWRMFMLDSDARLLDDC